jgi:hypothetical protein
MVQSIIATDAEKIILGTLHAHFEQQNTVNIMQIGNENLVKTERYVTMKTHNTFYRLGNIHSKQTHTKRKKL